MDGRKITDMKLGLKERVAPAAALKVTRGTIVEQMLKEYGLV